MPLRAQESGVGAMVLACMAAAVAAAGAEPDPAGDGTGQPAPSAKAAARANRLKARIDDFELHLRYCGPPTGSYCCLTLVAPAAKSRWEQVLRKADPLAPVVPIGKVLAEKVVDRLAADGFLDAASEWDLRRKARRAEPKGPTYLLRVRGMEPHIILEEDLGWDLKMLMRLDVLREAMAAAEPVQGGLCPECRGKQFPKNARKCVCCGGQTGLNLCQGCSAKLRQCSWCRAPLFGPATAAMDRLLERMAENRKRWGAAGAGEEAIAALIARLGHADWKARESATRKLIALGERAVRGPLEAKAKQEGLDEEVAGRIEHILDTFDPKEGARVKDRASGIIVSIADGGQTLEAAKDGKRLWRLKLAGKAESLRLDGGRVMVAPLNWLVDLQTGKVLMAGQRLFRLRNAGGAVIVR